MNNKFKVIVILILVLLYDRVEFLYYGVDLESKICLIIGNRCFRADSFIYYASIRIQYIIFAVILQMAMPMLMKGLEKALLWILIANVLYFVEYFFTYNEPIYKIVMMHNWYIPVSIATVKLAAWCYLSYEVGKRMIQL